MSGEPCACGSGRTYAECCEPYHLGDVAAPTAEALMRSRYTAFARGNGAYLLRTWHPMTRPEHVDVDDGTVWRRLQIVDTVRGGEGDVTGVVEFRAAYRDASGAAGLVEERSRFDRIGGVWLYTGAEVAPAAR
ncbi:YchJ family protein [Pseudolysinimonas sp.]|uniref:YchJ family protein n=1 Tax=Pseudolysinimonas sp. TaxID=2680009 RepID=UPI003F7EB4B1